jgi:hypothetical protein
MSTGLAEASARVAQLQSLLGVRRGGVLGGGPGGDAVGGTSSTRFDQTLADVLGSAGTGSPAVGTAAVDIARTYAGVPYRWGGTDPATGLDCSGLVQLVYGRLGVELPRVAADQAKAGTAVPSLSQAQPGDLLFFGSPAHHVGIYVGAGKMIDAPRAGRTVGVHEVTGYGTVSTIRRVSGGATASAAGAGAPTGPYAALFLAAGRRYGVDPALLSAVAKVESSYDPSATSSAGARGLMQLMPGTARSLAVEPDDPAQAVDGAARLLSTLLKQFDGRTDLALAGYNAGAGAVRRYGGIPPFPETRTYVHRVTRAWEALR